MAEAAARDAQDLAEFAKSRSAEAFARLSRRYAGLVYRTCLRRLGSEADAEDAAQAVFVALSRKARKIRPDRLAAWLHSAAMRASLFIARSRANRARYEGEAARMKSAENGRSESPDREALAHLDAEIERLPAKLREALARHYLAGLSRSELAGELGVPEGTVQSRLSAGLEKLRARLGGRGVRLGAVALAGLLSAEAAAGAPASLLASLPTLVSGSAAGGAAAAAGAGAGVSLIAEGVLKAMLLTKIKIAAAVLAAATLLAGIGTPLAVSAAGGGDGAVKVPAGTVKKPAKAVKGPTVPAGSEVVNGLQLKLEEVACRTAGSGVGAVLDRRVNAQFVDAPLKEVLNFLGQVGGVPFHLEDGARNKALSFKITGKSLSECIDAILAACPDLEVRFVGKPRFERDTVVFRKKGGAYLDYRLRWINVGKKPLVLYRDRCCDLYGRVMVKGPDGKIAPARTDNRDRKQHLGTQIVRVEPGKADDGLLDPWFYTMKPSAPGEYTLWVEFECLALPPRSKTPAALVGATEWTGKVRSNPIRAVLGPAAPKRPAKPVTPAKPKPADPGEVF